MSARAERGVADAPRDILRGDREAAEYLRISEREVRSLRSSGELQSYRRGRVVWFLAFDLLEFVRRHRVMAEGGAQ